MRLEVDERGIWSAQYRDQRFMSECGFALDTDLHAKPTLVAQRDQTGADLLGTYREISSEFTCTGHLEVSRSIRVYDDEELLAVYFRIRNTSTTREIRLREVRLIYGLLHIPCEDARVLTNDWERCAEKDNLADLRGECAVGSAWNMCAYSRKGELCVAAGILSAREMFTSIELERRSADTCRFMVTGDTRSGNDGVLLLPNEVLTTDGFIILADRCPYAGIEHYANAVKTYNNVTLSANTASGWLDWYCYYGDISEQTVLANLQTIDEKLKGYGARYIQIDDGWQKIRQYTYYEEIDLRCTSCSGAPWEPNEWFPHGMKALADKIHERGYKAGLWVRPFSIMNEAEEYKRGEPWVVKYAEEDAMPDRAFVDISQGAALNWLGELFRKITSDWGYDYIKFDFVLYDMLLDQTFKHTKSALGALRIGNPRITSARAFHNALVRFRESVAEGTFLLGCNCLAGSAIGIVDGYRVSDDVLLGQWDRNRAMRRATAQRYYQNRVFWQNDPDVLMVSDKVPIEQAQLWASLVALSGSLIMLGDSLPELPDERIEILKKVLPRYSGKGRPLRLFEESYPPIWHLPVDKPFGRWDVVGLYNWYEEKVTLGFEFAEIGLDSHSTYALFDFWQGEYLGDFDREYTAELEAMSCRVLSVRERKDVPQVISTQYHITQGGNELENEEWNAHERTLSIRTTGVPTSTFRLYVGVPDGFTLDHLDIANNEARLTRRRKELLEVEFRVSENGADELRIAFKKEQE
jgi:hypothetical protein